jgi:hypothetical protein
MNFGVVLLRFSFLSTFVEGLSWMEKKSKKIFSAERK